MIDAKYSAIPVIVAYETDQDNGAVNSASVDVTGIHGLAFHVTTFGGTVTTATMKLQTSADGSTWVDAEKFETVGENDGDLTVVLSDNASTGALGYSGLKQYVRAVVTMVSSGAKVSVVACSLPNNFALGNPIAAAADNK